MVFAAPTKLASNQTRRPSVSAIVHSAPTVGPSIAYMPPAIAANTIRSDTPMPDTVSGLRYIRYCPNTAPPREVRAAQLPARDVDADGGSCLLIVGYCFERFATDTAVGMAGLVPAVRDLPYRERKRWMPGTRPGMTTEGLCRVRRP